MGAIDVSADADIGAAEVVVARAVSEQGVDASRRGVQPDGEPVQQDRAHAVVALETGLDRRGSAEQPARGEHPGHGIVGDPLTLETGARLGGDESETGQPPPRGGDDAVVRLVRIQGILVVDVAGRIIDPHGAMIRAQSDGVHSPTPSRRWF